MKFTIFTLIYLVVLNLGSSKDRVINQRSLSKILYRLEKYRLPAVEILLISGSNN